MISIDPGTRGHGVAMWTTGTGTGMLQEVYYLQATGSTLEEHARHLHRLVATMRRGWNKETPVIAEIPQSYGMQQQKGDQGDLIALAYVLGATIGANPHKLVLPRTWKGQVPKEACHRRIRAALRPEEITRLDEGLRTVPKGKQHNVLDAVGIGLWGLKRKW